MKIAETMDSFVGRTESKSGSGGGGEPNADPDDADADAARGARADDLFARNLARDWLKKGDDATLRTATQSRSSVEDAATSGGRVGVDFASEFLASRTLRTGDDPQDAAGKDRVPIESLDELLAQHVLSPPDVPDSLLKVSMTYSSKRSLSSGVTCSDASFASITASDEDSASDECVDDSQWIPSADQKGETVEAAESTPLAYRTLDGWKRVVVSVAGNAKLRWVREPSPGDDSVAFVRHLQSLDRDIIRTGRLRAVDVGECLLDAGFSDHDRGDPSSEGKACAISFGEISSVHQKKYRDKVEWFRKACDRIRDDGRVSISVQSEFLPSDTLEAVMSLDRADLRKEWILESVGSPLPKEEWFGAVTQELFDPSMGLWMASTYGRMRINPASELGCPGDHLRYFRFIGRFMGKALFDGIPCPGRMAKYLYKHILCWPITLKDLEDGDEEHYNTLKGLKFLGPNIKHLEKKFAVTEESLGMKTELIPNGAQIRVTEDNLPQYIDACLKHRLLGRYRDQLRELLLGFFGVVPEPLLAVFDHRELEAIMCGSHHDKRSSTGKMFRSHTQEAPPRHHRRHASSSSSNKFLSSLDFGESSAIYATPGKPPLHDRRLSRSNEFAHKRQTSRSDEFVYDSQPQYQHLVDEVYVKGCGVPEANGKYVRGGLSNVVPMYSRIAFYNGIEEKFCIFQCRVSDSTLRWYLSIVPMKGDRRRTEDSDFYIAEPASSMDLTFPPRAGWRCNANTSGKEPNPEIFYRLPSFDEACALADEALSAADGKKESDSIKERQDIIKRTRSEPSATKTSTTVAISDNEMLADSLSTFLHRLSDAYQDRRRVEKDVESLLSSTLGAHLRPTAEPLMLKDGSSTPPLLVLRGTLPLTYQGVTYNLPIDFHLPPEYPLEPPKVFIRPVASMAIESGSRYVSLDGRVVIPYLREWASETHELRELAVSMSNLLGSEPPWINACNSASNGSNIDDDESMDELAKLVNQAAIVQDRNLQNLVLPPKGIHVLSNTELRLCEPENPSDLTLFSGGLKEFDQFRMSLLSVVVSNADPIQIPQKYIELIKTTKLLGSGYFGQVCLGKDDALGKKFAIKLINPLVIEQSLTSRLRSIHKSFQNEVKILSQLKHPNIAPLYGYYMREDDLENSSLLYELATNESLDKFWGGKDNENRLGRERLSEAKVRARIALEVATVLRYMHEGLDGGAACFHRDIKSANVCVASDLSVRVIDCGLSKYVTEEPGTFTSAGPSGTPGYTCPQYIHGEIPFGSACDVFSFGVFLCEVIIGKTNSRHAAHYPTYKLTKRRRLEDDADECVDWETGDFHSVLIKLALECMEYEASSRPSIGDLVKQLQRCFRNSEPVSGDDSRLVIDTSLPTKSLRGDVKLSSKKVDTESGKCCRICGEVSDKSIKCHGNQRHVHCNNCVEKQLIRNANNLKYEGLVCLKEGCNSRPFHDDEILGMVSQNFRDLYLLQRNSSNVFQLVASMEKNADARFRQMRDLQLKLCAGNGLPCPKLFLLIEADRDVKLWRNPREWAKNKKGAKLYLHFVCSHSLQPVSDKCRIKVRYTHDWLRSIAPALNASLEVIKMSLNLSLGRETPLDLVKIGQMDEWAKGLLGEKEKKLIEGPGLSRSDEAFQTLIGNSLSNVAEKAASSNINWQSELVPVFDSEKNEPTFVMAKYSSEHRYQGKQALAKLPE